MRILVALMMSFFVCLAFADSQFSAGQKEQIGKIAADYLVAHPEFLIQASKVLQERQQKEQQTALSKTISGYGKGGKKIHSQLLSDSHTPFVGPKNGSVAVIEFFDYQCLFCNKVNPAFEAIEKNNPNVKFIFKDFPIFGERWAPSFYAANVGVMAFKQGGSALYKQYHNAIFDSGKDEGKLKFADINKIAQSLKINLGTNKVSDESAKVKPADSVKANMQLGGQLQIMGTPFIIVMPRQGANVDNITVFQGYPANPQAGKKAAVDALQKAIAKASGKQS